MTNSWMTVGTIWLDKVEIFIRYSRTSTGPLFQIHTHSKVSSDTNLYSDDIFEAVKIAENIRKLILTETTPGAL